MFSSILAQVKGEKAPVKKATSKVKSMTAPKRETARPTSTASQKSPVRKRAVGQHVAPVAQTLPPLPPVPAQSNSRSDEAAPHRPLPVPNTRVYETNRSAIPVDDLVEILLAPHPVVVRQAVAREAAARQAAAQQQSRPHRRRAPNRRQPVAPRFDQGNTSRPDQRQVFGQYRPLVPKVERKPKRLIKPSYEAMNRLALLDEAQVRELELDGEDKKYLVDVLVLNDEAYVELMDQIGCRVLVIDFAQGAVRHHNQNLRRERAEAEAAQQQDIHEAHKKKKQEERAKAEKLAFEKRQAEKRAKELKQAADAKEHEQKRKRKESQNPDSGYSSKSSASPETGESSDTASSKGKKRARPNYDNAEDSTPNKKVKSSQTSKAPRVIKPKRKPAALPRAMQAGATKASSANSKDVEMSDKPVKSASKKTTKVASPSTRPSQTGRPRTRSNWVVEDAEDEDMEDADQDTDNESEFADFIEDDMGGRKRKSNIGAMASSKLCAGL